LPGRAAVAAGSFLLGLAVCLLPACRPRAETASEIALSWTIAPHPPAVGPARFLLMLTDKSTGQLVSGARVQIEGNMSHPGMQPVFGAAREVVHGRYEAKLELTMAGDWIVLVDATLPDGRTVRRQMELPGVRAPETP
jgi:hypothetical protein